ncbi:hypothetical protein BDV09DRAFT_165461 [Aspergillus tetrazonus]
MFLLSGKLLGGVLVAEAVHSDGLEAGTGTNLWASATRLIACIFFALAPVVQGKVLAAHFSSSLLLDKFFSLFLLFFSSVVLSRRISFARLGAADVVGWRSAKCARTPLTSGDNADSSAPQ